MALASFVASLPSGGLAPTPGYLSLRALIERTIELTPGGAQVHLGDSVEGRPLVAIDVGNLQARRASVVVAGLHAMEWIGVEVGLAVLTRLIADPPTDRRVRVHFLANPDGYARVEAGLRAGRRRFDRSNASSVDLNRNWPTHWTGRHWRTRVLPFLGHGGNAPRSEPEVDAICRGLDELVAAGCQIDRALSLHSFGKKVLFPYGGVWRRVDDYAQHRSEADWIADRIGYDAVQSSRWVPGAFAKGMELDHLHDHYGALALLIECSSGGFRWSQPSTWLHPFRWFNPPDPREVAGALAPTLEAFVRD